jgi:hypothetical protein
MTSRDEFARVQLEPPASDDSSEAEDSDYESIFSDMEPVKEYIKPGERVRPSSQRVKAPLPQSLGKDGDSSGSESGEDGFGIGALRLKTREHWRLTT